ncbi:MAG: hypothetical protein II214_04615 [Alistipes sp.]|nr:hypothetical protein [Alistipes sp.]
MAKIKVELNASYGCDCMGCGYGSEETIEIEVNDQELEALRKLGTEEISCEAVVEAIESGYTTLQSLHEQLEEKFYYMVEEYWLYEAYNECLYDSLDQSIEKDMDEGIYPPVSFEDVLEWFETAGNISLDDCAMNFVEDFDTSYIYDEKDLRDKYDEYIQEKYYDWVKEHDHEFVAERVGLDLDACRDDEVDYTIMLSE